VQLELVAEINHPIIIEIIYKKRDAIVSLFYGMMFHLHPNAIVLLSPK
jgi:hypothetical protein